MCKASKNNKQNRHKQLKVLKNLRRSPVDNINLTLSNRRPNQYEYLINIKDTLSIYCKKLSKDLNRKITILDSGCGEGGTATELLKDRSLNKIIEKYTASSLHYFSTIEKVIKLSKRFDYYNVKIQKLLPLCDNSFDLILDVCGAYTYSKDKLKLLHMYYNSLKPGGKAFICVNTMDTIEYPNGENRVFIEYICNNIPSVLSAVFFLTHDKKFTLGRLLISKPLTDHKDIIANKFNDLCKETKLVSYCKKGAIINSEKYSNLELKKGNALYYAVKYQSMKKSN